MKSTLVAQLLCYLFLPAKALNINDCTGKDNYINNILRVDPDHNVILEDYNKPYEWWFSAGIYRGINLQAMTSECSNEPVASVLFEVDGTSRCENRAPYTVFGERVDSETGEVDYSTLGDTNSKQHRTQKGTVKALPEFLLTRVFV